MKKEFKVVAIALAALVFFLGGVVVGTTNGGVNIKVEYAGGSGSVDTGATQPPTTTAAPVTTTAAPVTEAPTTAAPAGDATTAAPAGDATTAAPADTGSKVPSTPAEIAAAYNKALNEYRAFTGTVTTKKTETIDIQAKDLPAAIEGIVNGVVQSFTGTTTNEWVFTNGVDPEGRKPADKIIPGGRDAAVTEAGLASATATATGDGGYTMTMKFVSETSVFDGTTNTSVPTHHMGAMDPLDLGTLSLDPIKITSANMTYPGATLEATVDAQGRLVKLHNNLPLEGEGSGGVGFINATIKIGGSMDSTWEMTYA